MAKKKSEPQSEEPLSEPQSESDNPRKICVYTGRFQPFGPHHHLIYQTLQEEFGPENVFISTSDKNFYSKKPYDIKEIKSPFNFSEKKKIIESYGVNGNKIIQVKSNYNLKDPELEKRLKSEGFDLSKIALIIVVGIKDSKRINTGLKKDGTPSAFSLYSGSDNLEPLSNEKGYIYIHDDSQGKPFKMPNGSVMSGTTLRNYLINSSEKEFKEILTSMNDNDGELYKLITRRLQKINKIILENKDDKLKPKKTINKTKKEKGKFKKIHTVIKTKLHKKKTFKKQKNKKSTRKKNKRPLR